jgi:oligopeptide transport system substrate-binding protein
MAVSAFRKILVLALGIALGACGSGEREVDRAAAQGILLVGNYGEPPTLDPHLVTGVPGNHILVELMEALTVQHPTNKGQVVPGLAESWEHNDSFTQWTFYLRKNAKWTNGDPVVAGDILYSWRRILSPELGAQYADLLHIVRGAEAYNMGEIADFSRVGVSAPDDFTVVVDLVQPSPEFDFLLSAPSLGPMNQRVIESHGSMTDRRNEWSTMENYVSNGPFRLKEWRVNQVIELEKNPDYWDAANVKLNAVRFFPIDNSKTEENLFFDGRLHVTSTISADKIPYHRENNADVLVSTPAFGNYHYYINVEKKPLDDIRVRQALSLAIDRQLLVDRVVQGGESPAGGFLPPGFSDYPTSNQIAYDPDRARQLLADAGYPGGKGFPVHEILMNTLESHRKIAEAIQEMWRKELGIDVGIYNQEWRVYLDSMNNNDFSLARAGLSYTMPDAYSALYWMGTGGLFNRGKWSDARYDKLLENARDEIDLKRRNQLLKQAETILNTDLPVIPLYWSRNNFLLDPQVKGWSKNLYDNPPFKHVYFESE